MENRQYDRAELLYSIILFIWLLLSFLRTSCIGALVGIKEHSKEILYVVLFLTVLDLMLCHKKEVKHYLVLLACVCLALLAYKRVSLTLAVSFLLIYTAGRFSFQKLAKRLLIFYSSMISLTILLMIIGVTEDILFYEDMGERVRHSLGFTYCSYASHYMLTLMMLYLVVRETVQIREFIPIVIVNYVIYYLTDTKADYILCILLLLLAVLAGGFGKYFRKEKWYIIPGGLIPILFLGISYISARKADFNLEIWRKINGVLNGRLQLGESAISQYGVHLWGKKIEWIGVAQAADDPGALYNYVDNIYLQTLLSMGIIFTIIMCLVLGRMFVGSLRQGYMMRAVVIFVFLLHGLVDPQLRSLCYDPFLLLAFSEESNCLYTKRKE